jgi:hypothetical protein
MATHKKKEEELELSIPDIKQNKLQICVLGQSLIQNKFSDHSMREILQPSPKKNKAVKQSGPKHWVLEEYRAAAHTLESGPTYLGMPSLCFKGALRNAALDIPGATKAQIGRLTYVEGDYVEIYGIPQMYMDIVRNSDPGHTPDVRTRPRLRSWAAKLTISYVAPLLQEKIVVGLLSAGGIICGVGDFRAEKGLSNNGQFKLVNAHDPDFLQIVKTGGRKAQMAAMENPTFYNKESENLYHWYIDEMKRRGFDMSKPPEGLFAPSQPVNGGEVAVH